MMTELMVRSLTPVELAERLVDHIDIAVVSLAKSVIENDSNCRDFEEEIGAVENARDEAQSEVSDLKEEVEEMKELLKECLPLIPDDQPELYDKINLASR
jgi:chromosome segregation ATPase